MCGWLKHDLNIFATTDKSDMDTGLDYLADVITTIRD